MIALFRKKGGGKQSLAERCKAYLQAGPPASMDTYMPGSLTEIIIAHGASGDVLDDELREVADLILLDAGTDGYSYANADVGDYMKRGERLVREVLSAQS